MVTPDPAPSATDGRRRELAATMRRLLAARAVQSTICPSDAARAVAPEGWRDLMPLAREVAYGLAADGVLEVRQGGIRVQPGTTRGPIRLGRGPGFDGSR